MSAVVFDSFGIIEDGEVVFLYQPGERLVCDNRLAALDRVNRPSKNGHARRMAGEVKGAPRFLPRSKDKDRR